MRILIAEDDAISARLLQAMLVKWGDEVEITHDGSEAWAKLQEPSAPRLVILDWMMPGMDGVEISRRIRGRSDAPYTYVVLLTARTRKEDIIEGMEAGADDYITKPFDSQELKVRLRAGKRILELQAALLTAQEALRIEATQDPLTGLWNRRILMDRLYHELERASREEASLSVIMADLDDFKHVNDTFGHMAGDSVLREVATRMKSVVRSYDIVGRYGGEEFLLILPGCDTGLAVEIAERVREVIAAKPLSTSEGAVPITISLGVATIALRDWRAGAESAVHAADAALYEAKLAGKNRIALARDFVLTA